MAYVTEPREAISPRRMRTGQTVKGLASESTAPTVLAQLPDVSEAGHASIDSQVSKPRFDAPHGGQYKSPIGAHRGPELPDCVPTLPASLTQSQTIDTKALVDSTSSARKAHRSTLPHAVESTDSQPSGDLRELMIKLGATVIAAMLIFYAVKNIQTRPVPQPTVDSTWTLDEDEPRMALRDKATETVSAIVEPTKAKPLSVPQFVSADAITEKVEPQLPATGAEDGAYPSTRFPTLRPTTMGEPATQVPSNQPQHSVRLEGIIQEFPR